METCRRCRGKGKVECEAEWGRDNHPPECPWCWGENWSECPDCNGTGEVEEEEY